MEKACLHAGSELEDEITEQEKKEYEEANITKKKKKLSRTRTILRRRRRRKEEEDLLERFRLESKTYVWYEVLILESPGAPERQS